MCQPGFADLFVHTAYLEPDVSREHRRLTPFEHQYPHPVIEPMLDNTALELLAERARGDSNAYRNRYPYSMPSWT